MEEQDDEPCVQRGMGTEHTPKEKKKRAPNQLRQWKEYSRWSRSDNTDEEIMALIRADLSELNTKAGITSLPSRHRDRKKGNMYGDCMYRHSWSTGKGAIRFTSLLCPLVQRCGCACEVKIEEAPGRFILYVHAEHTADDHQRDNSKYLSYETQDLIRSAVRTAPMNSASELIKSTQDSPTKRIDPKLKKSVARLVRRERAKSRTVVCEGAALDLESHKQLADTNLSAPAVQAHVAGVESGAQSLPPPAPVRPVPLQELCDAVPGRVSALPVERPPPIQLGGLTGPVGGPDLGLAEPAASDRRRPAPVLEESGGCEEAAIVGWLAGMGLGRYAELLLQAGWDSIEVSSSVSVGMFGCLPQIYCSVANGRLVWLEH